MLYKIEHDGGRRKISAQPFMNYEGLRQLEKDLEHLLAENLLNVLFEDASLMPIFQERNFQPEADIYALNKNGDLILFELKRGLSGVDAINQLLRYCQESGQWTYDQLERKYLSYCKCLKLSEKSLADAHQEAFQLERPLLPSGFNQRQRLVIVGNAANEDLVKAVDFWKRQGLTVEFVPYRIYEIGNEQYFEFFSHPYDWHTNPSETKGVLFDTNRTYDENLVWHMLEKSRVSAFGEVKHVIEYVKPKDIVFLTHRWTGVVAAAEVVGPVRRDGENEMYRDVKFLTPIPSRAVGIEKYMTFSRVAEAVGKSFFWARTIKVPYLTRDESHQLIGKLKEELAS